MNWKRWLPTSKMTAVFVSGFLCIWGTFALKQFYGLSLDPVEAALNTVWITFLAGYVTTENRGK